MECPDSKRNGGQDKNNEVSTGNFLKPTDLEWLNKLKAPISRVITLEDVPLINSIIAEASINPTMIENPLAVDAIIKARHAFFEDVLGWNLDKDNPMSNAYRAVSRVNSGSFLAPSTVVESMRTCDGYGLDVNTIARYAPLVLSNTSEKIKSMYTHLEEIGLDAHKIVSGKPTVLGSSIETVDQRIAKLTTLGLDYKIVNQAPAILAYSNDGIDEKIKAISDLGIDAVQLIHSFPNVLGANPDTLSNKVYALMRYGYLDDDNIFPAQDSTFVKKFCIIPNESLLLYLDHLESTGERVGDIRFLPDRASDYMKSLQAVTATKRRELFKEQYKRGLPARMGYLATLQAMRTDKEMPLLEGMEPRKLFKQTKSNMFELT